MEVADSGGGGSVRISRRAKGGNNHTPGEGAISKLGAAQSRVEMDKGDSAHGKDNF